MYYRKKTKIFTERSVLNGLAMILCVTICGCEFFREGQKFNTEIFCPNSSYRILILKSTKAEVRYSIEQAIGYYEKRLQKDRYTVLYLPHNRSTSIYNTIPQELLQCQLIERPRN